MSICLFVPCVSIVCLYFCFQEITFGVSVSGFSPNMVHVCALILLKSGLGLLNGKISAILDGVVCPHKWVLSFLDDNLNNNEWIFT